MTLFACAFHSFKRCVVRCLSFTLTPSRKLTSAVQWSENDVIDGNINGNGNVN